MIGRNPFAALLTAMALAVSGGCTPMRGQESIGGYVDDAAVTTTIKSRLVEDKSVDAAAIRVETQNGNVTLSGSARNPLEKQTAESIAMKVRGVKTVQNNVAVRP